MNVMKNRKIFNSLLISFLAIFFVVLLGVFAIAQPKMAKLEQISTEEALAYTPSYSPDGRNYSGGHTVNKSMWPTTISTAGTHALNTNVSSYWAMNMSSGANKDYKSTSTEIKCDQGSSFDKKRYMYSWTTIPISSAMTNAIAAGKVTMTFSMEWHHGTDGGDRRTAIMLEWGTGDNGLNGFSRIAGNGTSKDGAFKSWQSSSTTLSGAYSGVTRIRVGIANRKEGVGRHLDCFGRNMSLSISNELSVTAENKSKTYGDSDPSLTYYVSSGYLLGSWTGALSRDSGENVGSYTIRQGSLGVSSGNTIESFTNATLTINKRNVTVTAENKTVTYGETTPLTYTHTSLGNGTALTGTLGRASGNNVGSYAINQGSVTNANNTNYNISFVAGTYKIERRSVTVTPNAGQTKVYGDNDPIIEFTAVNMVGAEVLNGTLERQGGNNVGDSYAIYQGSVTNANNTNYDISFVGGVTFGIVPRPITITPNTGQTKTYGDDEPTNGYTYAVGGSGLAYTDQLSGKLVRGNLEIEDVGHYYINQGSITNGNNTNYAITFVSSVQMEITRRTVNVSAEPKTITYGDTPLALTYTHSSLGNGVALTGTLSRDPGDDAGSYNILQGTVTGGASGTNSNYNINFTGATYKINKKAVIVHIEDKSSDYKVTPFQTLTWYLDESTPLCYYQGPGVLDIVLTKAIGTNAGTYDITGSQGAGASGNYAVTFQGSNGTKGVYTINKINRNIQTDTVVTVYTYDGTTQTVNSGAYFNVADQEVNPAEDNIVYSTNTFKDVPTGGKQTVNLNQAATTNYFACSATVEITINKLGVKVNIDSVSSVYGQDITTLTYGVDESTPLGTGDTALALGVSLSTAATISSDAGDYAITGSYVSNNYTVTFSGAWATYGKYTIHRADTIFNTSGVGTYTYTGNYQTITGVTLDQGDDWIVYNNNNFTDVPNVVSGENYGEIIITFSTQTTTNYNGKTENLTVKVYKADTTINTTGVTKTYTYSGVLQTVNSGATTNQVGTYKSTIVYSDNQFLNVPATGKQIVKINTASNNNYNAASTTVEITINKATAKINIADKETVYGVALEDLTFSVDASTPLQGPDQPEALGIVLNKVDGLSVNTYTISCSSYNQTNYILTFTNGVYTITKKSITVDIDDYSSAYGQAIQTLTCQVNSATPLAYEQQISVLDITLSTAASSIANAGTYEIVATQGGAASGNYTVTFSGTWSNGTSGTYTITKVTRNIITTLVEKDYVYNGSEQEVNSGATLSHYEALDSENEIVYSNNKFTSVPASGKQTVTLFVAESTNYAEVSTTVEINIAKYAIVLDIADKSSEYKEDLVSLSYAVNSGYALQGTDTNTALGVTLSTAATNTSNVGTYKISGTYTSTNYSVTFAGLYDGDTTSGRYTITPVSIIVDIDDQTAIYGEELIANANLTFDLNAESAALKSGDTLSGLGVSLVKAEGLDAKDYTISASGYTNNNYTITFNNGTYTITPKAITIVVQDKGITYGDDPVPLTYVLSSLSSMEYDDPLSVLAIILTKDEGTNAGQYAITGSQGDNKSANYTVTFENGWYYINKADREINTSGMTATVYRYNGFEQTITGATLNKLEVNPNENILEYTNNKFTTVPSSGTQTVGISIAESTNYNYASTTVEITILKAFAELVEGVVSEYTYSGANQDITLANSGISLNHTESDLVFSENTFKDVPASGIHTVTLTAAESDNYLGLNTTYDFNINKYGVSITVDSKETVYGTPVEELTWSLNGSLLGIDTQDCLGIVLSTLAQNGSNADTYAINVTQNSVNYIVTFNSASYVITKATANIEIVGDWTFTYDGTEQTIKTGANLNHGETTLVYSDNTFRDVPASGKQTVKITAEATQNYTAANLSVVATIKKAKMTVYIVDKTSVYNEDFVGLEYTLSGPALGTDTEADLNIVLSKALGVNVGEYAISAITNNSNYEFTISGSLGTTGEYKITKAQIVINTTGVPKVFTYDGTERVVNSGATTNQVGEHISGLTYTNNSFTDVDEGNGKIVTITALENANYYGTEATVTLTVNKAVTTIDDSGVWLTYTYDGTEQFVNSGATHDQSGKYVSETQYLNNSFINVPASGTKQITIFVPENINYLSATKYVTITISKAESSIGISEVVRDYVYNRLTQTVTGATLNHNECSITYSNHTFKDVPASGTQTVTLSTIETENYKSTSLSFDINISKAIQVIDTTNVKYKYFQDGATEELPIIINSGATVEDPEQTVSYSNNIYYTEEEADEAELLIYAAETTNYLYTSVIIIVVTKTMPEVDLSFFANHVYVYNGLLQTITSGAFLTKGAVGQEIYYQNNTFTTVAEGNALVLEVCVDRKGTYSGYKWFVTINVDKADTNITIDDTLCEFTYTGSPQTVECGSINHTETSITYTNNTFTTVAEGNALTVGLYAEETDNYKSASATTTIIVNKATSVIDKTGILTEYTFTGNVQTVTGATLNHDETELVYEDNTFTTVAEGNALNVVIKAIETDNYKAAETSLTITVNKATYNMEGVVLEGMTVDYTNDVYSLEVAGALPTGVTVNYLNNGKVIAGNYIVVAEFSGDYDNYNEIEDLSASLVINKIAYDFSELIYVDTVVTYNAIAQRITATNIPVGLDGIEVGYYYDGERTNIGVSKLSIHFVSDSPNYFVELVDTEKKADLTINPAIITVESDARYYSDYLDVDYIYLTTEHYKILGVQGDDAIGVGFTARFEDLEAVGEAVVLMTITSVNSMNYILPADPYIVELPAAIVYPIIIDIPEEVHFFDNAAKLPQISTTIAGMDVARTITIKDSTDSVIEEAINAGEYKILVRVYDEYAGIRTQTRTMRINKILPTIELIGSKTQTYGSFVPLGTKVSVSASDGSDLATSIKYSFANKTNPPAGTHTVTASFNGSRNYLPVRVNETITINKKPIGVAVSSDNQFIYNGSERTLNFATTATALGDQNVISLTYGVGGSAIKPGRYAVNVVVNNPNYEVTHVAGPRELVITKVPLYVSIENQVAIENEMRPFAISYRGFVAGEDESNLTEVPCAPDCTSFKAGEYTIVASEGVSDCYDFIYVPLEITVYKRDMSASTSNVCEFTAKGIYDGDSTIDVKAVDANKFFTTAFTSTNNITSAYRIDVSEAPEDGKDIQVVYNNIGIKKTLFTGAYYIDNAGNKTRISRSNITDGSINLTVSEDGGYVVVYTNYLWLYVLIAVIILVVALLIIRAYMTKRRSRRSRRSRPRWLA